MPYTRLRYHIVTATKDRQPLITPEIEEGLYDAMKQKAERLGGRILYINGTEDHVHIIAAIPPAIAVSAFIGGIKATGSLHVNKRIKKKDMHLWQRGFGAFTVFPDDMKALVDYVVNQKKHHALGTIIKGFERTEE